jgi:uncharacterized protein (TIGR03083 family)
MTLCPKEREWPITMGCMSEFTEFDRFDRAAATTMAVVNAVQPEQYGDPTPCTDWTVRRLLNHLIGGTKIFTAMLTGGDEVERSGDHVGLDPGASFGAAVGGLRAAFAADGTLDRVYASPIRQADRRARRTHPRIPPRGMTPANGHRARSQPRR